MKYISGLVLIAALAACGDANSPNPAGGVSGIVDDDTNANGGAVLPPTDGSDPQTDEALRFITDDDRLVVNGFVYDAENDEVLINNIPFDSDDQRYLRVADVDGDFGLYRSRTTDTTGLYEYFAVFKRSSSGDSQVGAVATNEYIDAGFGGITAQRLNDDVSLPTEGQYVYLGDYGGIRTVRNRDGEDNGINLVTGDVELIVDIEDFDRVGAVEGDVFNRSLTDTDGIAVPDSDLNQNIVFSTAPINFDDGTITGGNVLLRQRDENNENFETVQTGEWEGVFAGSSGREIAGAVRIGGPADTRELGTFIVNRQPE